MVVKPAPPVRKLVVLEEAMLISIANQQQIVKEFPFLKRLADLATKTSGCGSCGGNRARSAQREAAIAQAKSTILNMGDDRKRLLKALLNTQRIRISYKQGTKIVQQTF